MSVMPKHKRHSTATTAAAADRCAMETNEIPSDLAAQPVNEMESASDSATVNLISFDLDLDIDIDSPSSNLDSKRGDERVIDLSANLSLGNDLSEMLLSSIHEATETLLHPEADVERLPGTKDDMAGASGAVTDPESDDSESTILHNSSPKKTVSISTLSNYEPSLLRLLTQSNFHTYQLFTVSDRVSFPYGTISVLHVLRFPDLIKEWELYQKVINNYREPPPMATSLRSLSAPKHADKILSTRGEGLEGKLTIANGFDTRLFSRSVRLFPDERPRRVPYKLQGSNQAVENFLSVTHLQDRQKYAWNILSLECAFSNPTDEATLGKEFLELANDFFAGREVQDDEHYEKMCDCNTRDLEDKWEDSEFHWAKITRISPWNQELLSMQRSLLYEGVSAIFLQDIIQNNTMRKAMESRGEYYELKVVPQSTKINFSAKQLEEKHAEAATVVEHTNLEGAADGIEKPLGFSIAELEAMSQYDFGTAPKLPSNTRKTKKKHVKKVNEKKTDITINQTTKEALEADTDLILQGQLSKLKTAGEKGVKIAEPKLESLNSFVEESSATGDSEKGWSVVSKQLKSGSKVEGPVCISSVKGVDSGKTPSQPKQPTPSNHDSTIGGKAAILHAPGLSDSCLPRKKQQQGGANTATLAAKKTIPQETRHTNHSIRATSWKEVPTLPITSEHFPDLPTPSQAVHHADRSKNAARPFNTAGELPKKLTTPCAVFERGGTEKLKKAISRPVNSSNLLPPPQSAQGHAKRHAKQPVKNTAKTHSIVSTASNALENSAGSIPYPASKGGPAKKNISVKELDDSASLAKSKSPAIPKPNSNPVMNLGLHSNARDCANPSLQSLERSPATPTRVSLNNGSHTSVPTAVASPRAALATPDDAGSTIDDRTCSPSTAPTYDDSQCEVSPDTSNCLVATLPDCFQSDSQSRTAIEDTACISPAGEIVVKIPALAEYAPRLKPSSKEIDTSLISTSQGSGITFDENVPADIRQEIQNLLVNRELGKCSVDSPSQHALSTANGVATARDISDMSVSNLAPGETSASVVNGSSTRHEFLEIRTDFANIAAEARINFSGSDKVKPEAAKHLANIQPLKTGANDDLQPQVPIASSITQAHPPQLSDLHDDYQAQSGNSSDSDHCAEAAAKVEALLFETFAVKCTYCDVSGNSSTSRCLYLCSACGVQSKIRYCSRTCLLADSPDHSVQCVQYSVSRLATPVPDRLKVSYVYQAPRISRLAGVRESPELFRQKAFSGWCYTGQFPSLALAWAKKYSILPKAVANLDANNISGDYFVFRSELTGKGVRSTHKTDVIYTFRVPDDTEAAPEFSGKKIEFNRALNALFLVSDQVILKFVYRIILASIYGYKESKEVVEQGLVWIWEDVENEFNDQFAKEFNLDSTWYKQAIRGGNLDWDGEWVAVEQRLQSLERDHPELTGCLRS